MSETTTQWFCVGGDGDLHALGEHDDFDGAEDKAMALGLGSMWTFDLETARDWRDFLNQHAKDAP